MLKKKKKTIKRGRKCTGGGADTRKKHHPVYFFLVPAFTRKIENRTISGAHVRAAVAGECFHTFPPVPRISRPGPIPGAQRECLGVGGARVTRTTKRRRKPITVERKDYFVKPSR